MNTQTEKSLRSDAEELRLLITGMRDAYLRGENAMEYARQTGSATGNSPVATLIAYDLQAGSYIAEAKSNPSANLRWCSQLAEIIDPFLSEESSLLEVGCGEATTLAGVLRNVVRKPRYGLGLDISWSRCAEGQRWLAETKASARVFVADLFNIPLEDESVDVVYTSHSLEPNGGREEGAIRELMRVARHAVVLIEPIYELASTEAQSRMLRHGYVRGLKETAEGLGAKIGEYRLLENINNPLNPSGLILIEKYNVSTAHGAPRWRCPLTYQPMNDFGDVFAGEQADLAYPVLRGVPLLRVEHGVLASKILSN